jgi:hypothetical protein
MNGIPWEQPLGSSSSWDLKLPASWNSNLKLVDYQDFFFFALELFPFTRRKVNDFGGIPREFTFSKGSTKATMKGFAKNKVARTASEAVWP